MNSNELLIKTLEQLNLTLKAVQSHEDSTAQIILSIVPLLGVITGFTILFFFFMWRYRLQKELIRQGQFEPQKSHRFRLLTLLTGFVLSTIGLPMTILFFAIDGLTYAILGGLIPLSTGVGLLLFYYFSKQKI